MLAKRWPFVRIGGLGIVISAVLFGSTSFLYPTKDNDKHSSSPNLIHLQSDNKQRHHYFGNTSKRLTNYNQVHRRLSRILGKHKNHDVDGIAAKARAKAMEIQPAIQQRGDNDDILFLPPDILSTRGDLDELEFPDGNALYRYKKAAVHHKDPGLRELLDPLGPFQQLKLFNSTTKRVPFLPQVEYLGVLVDAGRHYFEIGWLKNLIVYLHRLRFNMILLRLTDDQAFNVKLESYPELSFPSASKRIEIEWINKTGNVATSFHQGKRVHKQHLTNKKTKKKDHKIHLHQNDKVYTPDQLRELVAFAKSHGIVMVPEINVPGHAGAWAGIPDLILNCPEFICSNGYGIPLNVEHPQLQTILKGVISEVIAIFDPPFLHLGGDEVNMAFECFEELGRKPFNYTKFEVLLKDILDDVGFPEDRVIRWEETGLFSPDESSTSISSRAGRIVQFWKSLPGSQSYHDLKTSSTPFFVSHGLYMDINHDKGAEHIFNKTVENFQVGKDSVYRPKGIIAAAFELGADFWAQRNVASRLIAIAMGAARLNFSSTSDFWEAFNSSCRDTLELSPMVCDLQGFVAVTKTRYLQDWKRTWNEWRDGICSRTTEPVHQLIMHKANANLQTSFIEANKHFWSSINKPIGKKRAVVHHDLSLIKAGAVHDHRRTRTRLGVLVDLVNSMHPIDLVAGLLKKYVSPLGISLAQVRLVDNFGFAIGLEHLSKASYNLLATASNPLPSSRDFLSMVRMAGDAGIELYPEISLSTLTGGWIEAGFALNCPQSFCNGTATRRIIANDITKPEFLPVVYSVVREIMEIFSTSNFLHLGSDERRSHKACFEEVGNQGDPPFAAFERKLTKLLKKHLGFSATQNIIRWENEEGVLYPDRTGDITHYRSTHPFTLPKIRPGEPFFVTLDLLAPSVDNTEANERRDPIPIFYEIYLNTRQLMSLQPLGILAELRAVDEVTWRMRHVDLRLISFTLGTRHERDDYTRDEFLEQLVKECQRVKFDDCESLKGRNLKEPQDELVYFVETPFFMKKVCDTHTVYDVKRMPRSTKSTQQ